MREHDLQPKRRRRYVVTTDSDHAGPIYPDLAKDLVPDRPNQLWVADLTYVAIPGGFVYLAAILDAWSRKVVGYAISRSMDARIAVAALKAAIRSRSRRQGLHSPFRSRIAIRVGGVSRAAGRPWPDRLDEPPRQSIRQRQGGELHEDAEGRGRLPGGLRDVRGRHRRSSALHRRGLQHQDGCTPRSAISARCSSRINTPSRRSKLQLDSVHPQGRTPQTGQFSMQLNSPITCRARRSSTSLKAMAHAPVPTAVPAWRSWART